MKFFINFFNDFRAIAYEATIHIEKYAFVFLNMIKIAGFFKIIFNFLCVRLRIKRNEIIEEGTKYK